MIGGLPFRAPPRLLTDSGQVRRIGVELEFASVSAQTGAQLIQKQFGGVIELEDAHRYHVKDTRFGCFVCELDSQYAHRSKNAAHHAALDQSGLGSLIDDLQVQVRRIYGDVSSLIVPCEIVCPPIAMTDLAELDGLVCALVMAGAAGTRSSPLYAFGAQLNPEIATDDPSWLAAMVKAFMLISDWLRAVMSIDATRRLTSFADPFPHGYVARVVNADYWPARDELIDDYLHANPTRNRELDLLPLFLSLDEDRVRARVSDRRVTARPTFHYRLPDANLGEPGWNVLLEWNRWCLVEHLAENTEVLNAMGTAYLQNRSRLIPRDWAVQSSEWLVLAQH